MTDFAHAIGSKPRRRRRAARLLVPGLAAASFALAGAPVAYMLWPQHPPVDINAPALPISIGGVNFNVPPAAIRVPMQRRPGAQARIDLAFLWPSLMPPDPKAKASPASPPSLSERLFVTIAGSDGTLKPVERLKEIYPRYTASGPATGPEGLLIRAFRDGTPYHGEDLVYEPTSPERFLLRCTRQISSTPGICLHERRIATADVTVRFPREWLSDWKAVAGGIDRLIASMRPDGA